ncbi:MAG: 50S ribosomal protein L4 [Planctomycetes bacterium]|nr:50S ribosomal protein L4 [Planctomycetota bacterium]
MILDVYKEDGTKNGTVEFDDAVLGTIVKRKLLSEVIRMYEARQRVGTRCTKARGEVSGGRRKPWRQKGTGRARQGSTRAVQWRGGAVALAPKQQDFSYSLPRKALLEAFRSALLAKIRDGEIHVLEDVSFDKPHTKRAAAILKALQVDKKRSLFVTPAVDGNFYRSFRNIPATGVLPVSQLNAYEVLRNGDLVFVKSSIDALLDRVKV